MDDRRSALRTLIAAQIEIAIADQHLKRLGVMKNSNTLRRVLKGDQDYRLSTLVSAAAGVNCEIEIVLKRKSA